MKRSIDSMMRSMFLINICIYIYIFIYIARPEINLVIEYSYHALCWDTYTTGLKGGGGFHGWGK